MYFAVFFPSPQLVIFEFKTLLHCGDLPDSDLFLLSESPSWSISIPWSVTVPGGGGGELGSLLNLPKDHSAWLWATMLQRLVQAAVGV